MSEMPTQPVEPTLAEIRLVQLQAENITRTAASNTSDEQSGLISPRGIELMRAYLGKTSHNVPKAQPSQHTTEE